MAWATAATTPPLNKILLHCKCKAVVTITKMDGGAFCFFWCTVDSEDLRIPRLTEFAHINVFLPCFEIFSSNLEDRYFWSLSHNDDDVDDNVDRGIFHNCHLVQMVLSLDRHRKNIALCRKRENLWLCEQILEIAPLFSCDNMKIWHIYWGYV